MISIERLGVFIMYVVILSRQSGQKIDWWNYNVIRYQHDNGVMFLTLAWCVPERHYLLVTYMMRHIHSNQL